MSNTLSTYKQLPNKEKRKASEEPEANLKSNKKMVTDQRSASKNQKKGKGISVVEEPKVIQDMKKEILEKEPDASDDSKYPKIFGVILMPFKGTRKGPYPCGLCEKSFLTPQALGGHQNGHRWEQSVKQTKEGIELFMESSKRSNFPSAPILPSYQGDGLDVTFQLAGTTSFNDGTMYFAQEIRNNSTFHHPPRVSTAYSTGSDILEIGNSAFQHPLSAMFNHGLGTNNYGKVHNISRQMNEAKETQPSRKSGFDFPVKR